MGVEKNEFFAFAFLCIIGYNIVNDKIEIK